MVSNDTNTNMTEPCKPFVALQFNSYHYIGIYYILDIGININDCVNHIFYVHIAYSLSILSIFTCMDHMRNLKLKDYEVNTNIIVANGCIMTQIMSTCEKRPYML